LHRRFFIFVCMWCNMQICMKRE
ncbi:unnamed protein product, partial [Trypanosoma congolense IL3000]